MKYCVVDFEYQGSSNKTLELVACCFKTEDGEWGKYWLYKDNDQKKLLKEKIIQLRDTHKFIAFNVVAEAQSFIALGIDPSKCQWIDLQIEWKMLVNHNDKCRYGNHYFDGREKRTVRRPYGADTDPKLNHDRPPVNLEGVTYFLLGKKPEDPKYKTRMRNLIIFNESFTPEEREQILEYCWSDIDNLFELLDEIIERYEDLEYFDTRPNYSEEMAWRGETAARTALMMSEGYPIDFEATKNFSKSVPDILKECQRDINDQFPELMPFELDKKKDNYVWKQKKTRDWVYRYCEDRGITNWETTATGNLSLSLDAWTRHFNYSHDYPRNNFGSQMVRFLKLKQSLNGFATTISAGRDSFWNYVGSDSRVRSWLNPYGAQTSRFQPKATGFIPLKAAWMRSLIKPKDGHLIVGVDYGSQEFLISAILSHDENMYEAYRSGDPYLFFAKLAGAVPKDGTKDEYKKERGLFKSTTLGLSYGMGAGALSRKITDDTGVPTSVDQATKLINDFYRAYPNYAKYRSDILKEYRNRRCLSLPDGWILWGDQDNDKSTQNFMVQGMGAAILRRAIALLQTNKLRVIYPLHDAIYCEIRYGDLAAIDLIVSKMKEAFCCYFEGEWKEKAASIRHDIDVWGPNASQLEGLTPGGLEFKAQDVYIDERSKREYEFFKKYFGNNAI